MSNWIDDVLVSAAVRRLFADVIAARPDLERHGALPPSGPDAAATGYWQPRHAGTCGQGARPLTDPGSDDAEHDANRLGEALTTLWTQPSPTRPDGLPELVALVPQITNLANRLRPDRPPPHSSGGPHRPQRPADAEPALIYPLF